MTLSHEFRAPLSSSLMILENVVERIKDSQPEIKRLLELIITEINLLLCLVNDILDLKMIENGNFREHWDFFAPKEVFMFIKNKFKI